MGKASSRQTNALATDRDGDIDPTAVRVEQEIVEEFRSTVDKGAERLHRSWRALITTAVFGGLEIGLGVLAYLAVLDATGSHLLAGVAFGIGFVALLLAHSELFTEGFLLPIMAVFAGRGTVLQLLRLWVVTLVANLVGGWIFMWLVAHAFPQYGDTLTESARHFVDAPLDLQAVSLALLGGIVITVLTRMQRGTESDGVKVAAAFGAGFVLAGVGLFHSVLDSILIFGAMHAQASVSYGEWLAWFWYVVPLNMLGGLIFVTAMRVVRASELPEAPGPDSGVAEEEVKRPASS